MKESLTNTFLRCCLKWGDQVERLGNDKIAKREDVQKDGANEARKIADGSIALRETRKECNRNGEQKQVMEESEEREEKQTDDVYRNNGKLHLDDRDEKFYFEHS